MLSRAEWEIMRVVWARDCVSANTIFETLADPLEWSRSTIKTLLSRLVKKGYLHHEKVAREFIYTSCVSEKQVLQEKQFEVLSHVCPKEVGAFFDDVLNGVVLSKHDIKQLLLTLQKKVDNVPEIIECTCIKGQCRCLHE